MSRRWRTRSRRTRVRRTLTYLVLAAAVALPAWKLIAEIIEPHALLWLRPASPALEAASVAGTTLRLHGDTRPHIGKIAGLQKGLVWVWRGRSLVEEGYGFGCPIVESQGQAYVSKTAEIETLPLQEGARLIKRYEMDTVDTPIRFLRRKYRRAPSLGTVTVQYDIYPDGVIDVEVDFSRMKRGWTKAYLMNEQGAHHFVHYADGSGLDLQAGDIGIWQRVDGSTRPMCFASETRDLRFCVEPEETPTVYYGRERYWQRNWRGLYYLAWAGIDIQVEAPRQTYRYRITLEAG
ncbi:MAG: hypothetical protein JSV36_11880 [Anaerolineae bacterium]|nr:MAG: hypothetical protein JSV36_11880 [Anaerolineae bacterium]